jgi:hypothetical protein
MQGKGNAFYPAFVTVPLRVASFFLCLAPPVLRMNQLPELFAAGFLLSIISSISSISSMPAN